MRFIQISARWKHFQLTSWRKDSCRSLHVFTESWQIPGSILQEILHRSSILLWRRESRRESSSERKKRSCPSNERERELLILGKRWRWSSVWNSIVVTKYPTMSPRFLVKFKELLVTWMISEVEAGSSWDVPLVAVEQPVSEHYRMDFHNHMQQLEFTNDLFIQNLFNA